MVLHRSPVESRPPGPVLADLEGPLLRGLAAARLGPAGDRPSPARLREQPRGGTRVRERAGRGDQGPSRRAPCRPAAHPADDRPAARQPSPAGLGAEPVQSAACLHPGRPGRSTSGVIVPHERRLLGLDRGLVQREGADLRRRQARGVAAQRARVGAVPAARQRAAHARARCTTCGWSTTAPACSTPAAETHPRPSGRSRSPRQTADVPVTYVPASQARSLCGHYLDWVEAIGPG